MVFPRIKFFGVSTKGYTHFANVTRNWQFRVEMHLSTHGYGHNGFSYLGASFASVNLEPLSKSVFVPIMIRKYYLVHMVSAITIVIGAEYVPPYQGRPE